MLELHAHTYAQNTAVLSMIYVLDKMPHSSTEIELHQVHSEQTCHFEKTQGSQLEWEPVRADDQHAYFESSQNGSTFFSHNYLNKVMIVPDSADPSDGSVIR